MQNNLLHTIMDFVPYCIFWKDRHGVFLGCNQKFANFAGKDSADDVIGKTDYDMPWQRFAEDYRADDQTVIKTEQPLYNHIELSRSTKATETTITVSKFPLRDENNQVIGVIGIYYDIAIGRDREASLLHEIIAYIPHHIFWKNRKGQFLGCNSLFAKAAGFKDPTELIGKTDYDMPWATQAAKYQEDDRQVMDSGQAQVDIEDPQRRPDGTEIVALVSKVPLQNSDNQTYGVLGIYNDITERKKQERELITAKRLAEEANKAKTDFITNMSHDVRTPITAMLGLTNAIIENADDTKLVKRNAVMLTNATNEILNIFNEVISSIEVEADQSLQKSINFSPRELIESNLRLIRPALSEKNLDLHFECTEEVPHYLCGKKILLDRIILNLLSNAAKFTEQGHISIQLSTVILDEESCRLILKVSDTGIGIAKEKRTKIFEKLYRINPSYSTRHIGYGLGLYLVKCAVDGLGGNIQVDSAPGKGSIFTVDCPFALGKSPKQSNDYTKLDTHCDAKDARAKDARVLLIEDHPLVASMQKDLFTTLGCLVDIAPTASGAKLLLIKNSYDLILIDLGLPDMSGIEFMHTIQNELNLKVPVVAITGHGTRHDRIECLTAGMQDMFNKPITAHTAELITNRYIQPDSRPSDTCIDLDYGAKLINQDTAGAMQMLQIFAKSVEADITMITESGAQNDFETMKKQLHRLRGGLAYCGLPALKKAGETLAETLTDGDIEHKKVQASLKKLVKQVERFKKALARL